MNSKIIFCNMFFDNYFKNDSSGTHTFVKKYLNELYTLSNYLIFHSNLIKEVSKLEVKSYKKEQNTSSLDFTKSVVKSYINSNNIYDIDIEDILENHSLFVDETSNPDLLANDGNTFYDENNKAVITIKEDKMIEDTCIYIHELSHYINSPEKKEDFTPVRDMFTEGLAYGEEFIFIDFLEEMGFINQSNEIKKAELIKLASSAERAYRILSLMMVYDKEGIVSLENYNNVFSNTANFEKDIDYLNSLNSEDPRLIHHSIKLLIACALSCYIYIEYKKDNSFIYKIRDLNLNINNINSLEEVLTYLNLNGLNEDSITKIVNDINDFIKLLLKNR